MTNKTLREEKRIKEIQAKNLFRNILVKEEDIEKVFYRKYPSLLLDSKYRSDFFDLIKFLEKKRTKLPMYSRFFKGLERIVKYKDYYIRNLEDVVFCGKSPDSHFFQLVDHLFVEYKMPFFWRNIWEDSSLATAYTEGWFVWFFMLARGESIVKTSPIPITKRQAHLFSKSNSKYHPSQALRIAQFVSLGGNMASSRGILYLQRMIRSTIKSTKEEEDFFIDLMRWFVPHRMLDPNKFIEIFDWAFDRKFNRNNVFHNENFTMKGRTIENVLIEAVKWHDDMNKIKNINSKVNWNGINVPDFIFEEHIEDSNYTIWEIKQILCGENLKREGMALRHCVISYLESCVRGDCSIWSMTKNGERILTLEIRGNAIVQAAGKANRAPTGKELEIVNKFCLKTKIYITKY